METANGRRFGAGMVDTPAGIATLRDVAASTDHIGRALLNAVAESCPLPC